MKKTGLALTLLTVLAITSASCGTAKDAPAAQNPQGQAASTEAKADSAESEAKVGLANPWRECTEEEAYQYGPNGFSAPEGAKNVHWSLMEVADNKTLPGTMVQMTFDLDGTAFTAREQPVAGGEIVDISGMYYDWTVTDEGTLANWGGGQMPFKSSRYIGEDGYVDVILWFDIETGYAYSLSAQAADLDGFDIQAVAEQIYDPDKQIGAHMPD
ncbi:MAG: hypothetical protein K5696_07005 [Lachnospiraceae bacterium]|nr:hypothetical protein [Lachnospiraceae bacterium]